MNLELSDEERAFRDKLRGIFAEVPAEVRARVRSGGTTRDDIVTSQQLLNRHGVVVPHWPAEHGGQD